MRWLAFVICAIVVISLQLTLAPWLAWSGVRPDWCLVLIVFFALHTRGLDALLGAWGVGAVLDLMTIERVGLLSLSYGIAALLVHAVREHLYAEHPLTHLVATLLAGLLMQTGLAVYRLSGSTAPAESAVAVFGHATLTAVYSALWAPGFHYVLLKFPHALGIRPPRSRHARRRRS